MVYQGTDGKFFVRPVSEFEDGRFVDEANPPYDADTVREARSIATGIVKDNLDYDFMAALQSIL